jgi:hypothetical protein
MTESGPSQYGQCLACDEPIFLGPVEPVPTGTLTGPRWTHRECALREVVGGIGHQIAHDYWCTRYHDPDAGLTYRQSALMVWELIRLLGPEEVSRRAAVAPTVDPEPLGQRLAVGLDPSDADDEWAVAVVVWADQEEPPEEPPPPMPHRSSPDSE